MAMIWVKFGTVAADYPQRDKLRIFTIMSIIKPLKTLLVYTIGIVVALVYLGIPLSLVLSIIGITGLALMLVCHPFVKDWIMGGLILWEDQYVVGDVIANGKYTGLVEKMSLRLTQLHTLEGRLVSIANGSITQVENLTRGWLHQDRQETVLPKKPLGAPTLLNGNSRSFGSTSSSEPTVSEP
jgi:small conductance mechanosensitive channel